MQRCDTVCMRNIIDYCFGEEAPLPIRQFGAGTGLCLITLISLILLFLLPLPLGYWVMYLVLLIFFFTICVAPIIFLIGFTNALFWKGKYKGLGLVLNLMGFLIIAGSMIAWRIF